MKNIEMNDSLVEPMWNPFHVCFVYIFIILFICLTGWHSESHIKERESARERD